MVAALTAINTARKTLDDSVITRLGEHPDAAIFTSLPRSGQINAAQVLAEWGDSRAAYDHPDAIAALAGVTPVTKASGKYRAVHFRWACNKRLRKAITCFADNSRHASPWAAKIYTDAIARGHDHPHAIRILARAWIRVIYRCWNTNTPYDPTAVEFQFIREWWSAMVLVELDRYSGRTGPGIRMVLRALGEAAMMTGSRYIEFGTRSLDVASGLDHTTVAKHLRQLRAEEDPLVYLIENDRGLLGDLYELRIPEEVVTRASRQSWRAGKIQALRPVFRDLGLPAAFVYEALEHSPDRLTSFELAGVTGMARSTVYEALETLAAFNLVEQRGGRWSIVATTSLVILAESLGCAAQISERLARHRLERQAYRRAMHVVVHLETAVRQELYDPLLSETESALDVLERILGARRLA